MWKQLAAVVASYALVIASMASAQPRVDSLQRVPEVPSIPPGEDVIEAVAEGDPAPFDGMLLDTDTAIRWTNALQWWPQTFQLRLDLFEDVLAETESSHQLRLRLVEDSYRREIAGLRGDLADLANDLAEARERDWYDTPVFGFVLGAAAVVLLLGAGGLLYAGLTN